MKHVFTSDELDMFTKFKNEARRARKRSSVPWTPEQRFEAKRKALIQLEEYRVSREGVDEAKPFGIDKEETIRVMSNQGLR